MGILRRAFERGKALPKKLERALKIQAGLALPDGQITDIDAYHINQRDEGIDLQGVSGALMATSNMQMQTFVTQASENTEGFDGYNGDLTGDVAATLGVNCGMSTGRNGVIAFAANQRDEVRDLHDVAGALNNAGRKGSIEAMPDTPGLAVWKSGHIGVYIGNGEVIEAMDTRYGVVKTKLQGRGWTHWLEVPGIKYD